MPFSVLKDEEIKDLLNSLTIDELEDFYTSLKETLHDYSNGIQSPETSEVYQPHRQSVRSSKTGATTLFMPSSGPAGFGVKGMRARTVPSSILQHRAYSIEHTDISIQELTTGT